MLASFAFIFCPPPSCGNGSPFVGYDEIRPKKDTGGGGHPPRRSLAYRPPPRRSIPTRYLSGKSIRSPAVACDFYVTGHSGHEIWIFIDSGRGSSTEYLSILLPSRLCPPLLIPWDDISDIEHCGLTGRRVELRSTIENNKQGINHHISDNFTDILEALFEGRWTYKHATKYGIFGKDEYR